jgi:predicted transcriptional regulator
MSNKSTIEELKNEYAEWKFQSLEQSNEKSNGIGFGAIFNGFAKYLPDLTGADLKVYIVLLLRANNNYGHTTVTTETITEDTGLSKSAVDGAIKHLTELGLIKRFRRGLSQSSITILRPYDPSWDRLKKKTNPPAEIENDDDIN